MRRPPATSTSAATASPITLPAGLPHEFDLGDGLRDVNVDAADVDLGDSSDLSANYGRISEMMMDYLGRMLAQPNSEFDASVLLSRYPSRSTRAKLFFQLLVLTSDSRIQIDQAVPYGPITLRRGAAFEMA